MKSKLFIGVAMSAMLFGCANTSELEAQVADLSNKVETLDQQNRAEHNQMKNDIRAARTVAEDAQAEAARANARIDNMATGYRK